MAISRISVTPRVWSQAATGPAHEPNGFQVARAVEHADSKPKAPPRLGERRNVSAEQRPINEWEEWDTKVSEQEWRNVRHVLWDHYLEIFPKRERVYGAWRNVNGLPTPTPPSEDKPDFTFRDRENPRNCAVDFLRMVKLDRAVQQAKRNNLSIVNTVTNERAYRLKLDLVRAVHRFYNARMSARLDHKGLLANADLSWIGLMRHQVQVSRLKLNGDPYNARQLEGTRSLQVFAQVGVNEYRAAEEQIKQARGKIDSMILGLSPKR